MKDKTIIFEATSNKKQSFIAIVGKDNKLLLYANWNFIKEYILLWFLIRNIENRMWWRMDDDTKDILYTYFK